MHRSITPPLSPDSQFSALQIFLIVDYQPVLQGLTKLIQGEYPRMQLVGTAVTHSAALTGVIQHKPSVVLLDYGLGSGSTLNFVSQLAVLGHHRILILVGQQYSPELGRRAIAFGACAVISKDAPAELILHAIECAHKQGQWSELFIQTKPVNERRQSSRHFS